MIIHQITDHVRSGERELKSRGKKEKPAALPLIPPPFASFQCPKGPFFLISRSRTRKGILAISTVFSILLITSRSGNFPVICVSAFFKFKFIFFFRGRRRKKGPKAKIMRKARIFWRAPNRNFAGAECGSKMGSMAQWGSAVAGPNRKGTAACSSTRRLHRRWRLAGGSRRWRGVVGSSSRWRHRCFRRREGRVAEDSRCRKASVAEETAEEVAESSKGRVGTAGKCCTLCRRLRSWRRCGSWPP